MPHCHDVRLPQARRSRWRPRNCSGGCGGDDEESSAASEPRTTPTEAPETVTITRTETVHEPERKARAARVGRRRAIAIARRTAGRVEHDISVTVRGGRVVEHERDRHDNGEDDD